MNLAEKYQPGQELGHACGYHAIVMTAIPMAGRGTRYAERACEIHANLGDRVGEGMARSRKGMSLTTLGRFREAVESGREAVRLLEEAGDVWEANMARIILSVPTYYSGELEEACRLARTVLRVGYETGDYMAIACAVLFGPPTATRFLDDALIQSEVERPRTDPLSICALMQGRGLDQLLRQDKPAEAAATIKESLDFAWKKKFRNPYINCGYAWRAEALRIVAEREPEGASRQKALKAARKAARTALFVTKLYHTSRAQALREMGTVLAMQGHQSKSRRCFDESIRVAELQEARYELARARLFRGRAGLQFGWNGAEEQLASAEAEVERITAFWRA
jgi:two-component system sensor kinase